MPQAFPWWTFTAGLAGACALALLRTKLLASAATIRPRERGWSPADVASMLTVVGIALLLRVHGLDARPLDNDEPVTAAFDGLDGWAVEDDARLHPPLPGLLMRAWTGGELDPVASRGVSVLAGVGAVALAFALGRRAGGRTSAWIAALLCAASPIALHTSQLARGYALLAFGLLLAHVCLTRALETGRERWWLAYTGASAVASLSEYLAIGPLLADAAVALAIARDHRARIGIITAFGSALVLLSFVVPFAWPSLTLGIGGGPHVETGVSAALEELGALLSGVLPVWAGATLIAVGVALSLRRRAETELRLLAQVAAALAMFLAAAELTAVRGRYVAHVWPMVAVLLAAATRHRPALGAPIAAVALVAHAGMLGPYYEGSTLRSDMATEAPIRAVLSRLRAEPLVPLAVAPAYAIGDPAWRLGRVLPGPTSRIDCPVTFCVDTPERSYYGVMLDSDWERRLLERHGRFFLLVRYAREDYTMPACRPLLREGTAILFDCGADARAR